MSFLSRTEGENTLVVDVSSGSTAAALVRVGAQALPELLLTIRTPFFISNSTERKSLESAMISSLRATFAGLSARLANLSAQGHKTNISSALVSFSSPWSTSHLKTVIIDRQEGFVLDEKLLKTIIDEEKELFSNMQKDAEEEKEIFESVVTNLYLNGYEAKHTTREKIKKAEISFMLSSVSKNLLWQIENEIIKAFGVKRGLALHSFTYAFFKVLSHAFQNLHSTLLINMASESTDILFLRHGNSALSASMEFGPGLIARELSGKLRIPQEVALSYLSIFASGIFDEDTTNAIDAVLEEVEQKWQIAWRNMGESIPEGSSVPYSIFLVVPASFVKLMKTFLEGLFVGKNIVALGETNTFTRELVKTDEKSLQDEPILILSSFSNLIK